MMLRPNKMSAMRKNGENRANCSQAGRSRAGTRCSATWLPSSGGTGSRLKIASPAFTIMSRCRNSSTPPPGRTTSGETRKTTPSATAATAPRTRFESGPAALTRMSPVDWRTERRKFAGFTGTGFAQPIGAPRSGRSKVPTGSMCGTGFRVSRPRRAAVSSPSRQADHAWKNSWNVRESRSTMRFSTRSRMRALSNAKASQGKGVL